MESRVAGGAAGGSALKKTTWVACLLAALHVGSAMGATGPVAHTRAGDVRGQFVEPDRIAVYKGIPYAAPPVGKLRWQPPQPLGSWHGVRGALTQPPACMQNVAGERLPWTKEYMHAGPVSEDCLYLNVWSPTQAARQQLPVFVYIYGGGFTEGSIAVPLYDGAQLARKGMVVVTLNYRVGVLGFLAHPELTSESPHHSSGNYGLLDQVAGLKWVQENIAAFGGDPRRVTLAGQSAGAMSVYLLTTSPLAKNLFAAAIVQSGPGALASFGITTRTLAQPLADAERAGLDVAGKVGAASLAELRKVDAHRLVETGMRLNPTVDGWLIPAASDEVYARGKQNDVPLLIGMMADEASAFAGYDAARAVDGRRRGLDALESLLAARAKTSRTPAYVYYFQHAIPWPEHPNYAAFHSGELPYMFDNLALLDRPWTAVDRALAAATSGYWASFVAHGNPNAAGLPHWPAFAPQAPRMMVFRDSPSAQSMRETPATPALSSSDSVGGSTPPAAR
jgi:para-nitrobenzyl esterase